MHTAVGGGKVEAVEHTHVAWSVLHVALSLSAAGRNNREERGIRLVVMRGSY